MMKIECDVCKKSFAQPSTEAGTMFHGHGNVPLKVKIPKPPSGELVEVNFSKPRVLDICAECLRNAFAAAGRVEEGALYLEGNDEDRKNFETARKVAEQQSPFGGFFSNHHQRHHPHAHRGEIVGGFPEDYQESAGYDPSKKPS